MTRRRQIHLVALLALGLATIWAGPSPTTTVQTATAKLLTWQDLVPTSVDGLVDTFEHLSDDQFFDSQSLARLSPMGLVVVREVHTPGGAEIIKRMTAAGLAPFALLDRFMAFVPELKQVNAVLSAHSICNRCACRAFFATNR